MNESMQSLAFFAGANSIFFGDKLLTTENNQMSQDLHLLQKLGIEIEKNEDEANEYTEFDEIVDSITTTITSHNKLNCYEVTC